MKTDPANKRCERNYSTKLWLIQKHAGVYVYFHFMNLKCNFYYTDLCFLQLSLFVIPGVMRRWPDLGRG